MAYGQSQALFNWALLAHLHHIISVWFVFVSYCSVDLFCALVIVVMVWFVCPKLQTWLATCFGPDKPAYSKKEPSYSLLLPYISQVSTYLTQRKPNYCILSTEHSRHPPDNCQITACIFQMGQIIACILPALQSASSEQEPSCGTWTPGRYL